MVNDKKSAVPKELPPPGMDKPTRNKVKRPKQPDSLKPAKKRKCEEGPSCSIFLAETSKKCSAKKKQEEERNIVQTIIGSIANALPIKFFKRTPSKKEPPVQIETLQSMAPELIPSDTVEIKIIKPEVQKGKEEGAKSAVVEPDPDSVSKMPRMPLKDSKDVMRILTQSKLDTVAVVEDASVNTGGALDVAGEIAKHVDTLKKISLIAEEFNQKTAKNLKEIVDSVQLDLLKKLEEMQAMERCASKYKETASRPLSPPMSPTLPPVLPSSVTLPPLTVPKVEPMQT